MGIKSNSNIRVIHNKNKLNKSNMSATIVVNSFERANKHPLLKKQRGEYGRSFESVPLDILLTLKKIIRQSEKKENIGRGKIDPRYLQLDVNEEKAESLINMGLITRPMGMMKNSKFTLTAKGAEVYKYDQNENIFPLNPKSPNYSLDTQMEELYTTFDGDINIGKQDDFFFPKTTGHVEIFEAATDGNKYLDSSVEKNNNPEVEKALEKLKNTFQLGNELTAYPYLFDKSSGVIILGVTYKKQLFHITMHKRHFNAFYNKYGNIRLKVSEGDLNDFLYKISTPGTPHSENSISLAIRDERDNVLGYVNQKIKIVMPESKYSKKILAAIKKHYQDK